MKRNTLFGGFALLVAGAAIGGGAAVTSNAMAAGEAGTPSTAEVTIISVGTDGEAVQCTYTGEEATAMMPPPVPADSFTPVGVGQISGTSGSITIGAPVDPDGETQVVEIGGGGLEGELPGVAGGEPVQVLPLDDARQGTPEECEAMKTAAPDGDQIIGIAGTVSVAGGGTADTSGTKP